MSHLTDPARRGPVLRVVDPATGEPLRSLGSDDDDGVASKAAAARAAQPAWGATPLAERAAVVRRFGELLEERREELARLLTSEMGKPITQSRAELAAMAERIAFFLEQTGPTVADQVVHRDPAVPGMEERIRYEPLGVVVNISAWNYPYFVGSNVFLPALLTGNAVLYKPSEHATLSGLAIADLFGEAGAPPGVFTPVVGAAGTGAALLEQDVDGVFFTGSWATGRSIAEAVAGRLVKVQLELGGKDPAYVCEDVEPEAAARAVAEGAFYNAGQSCCAVERVYVHRGIGRAFTDAFVETVRGFRVGDPMEEDTYIGPLAREAQLGVLSDQVADAVRLGGRLLVGGGRREGAGFFFEPTVVAGADHRMRLMREESFGPVIGLQEVDDDEQAIVRMNDTEYGLTAGVYTPDRARAERILARVDTGTAYWNCSDRVSPRLPWSGRKRSGLGCTLSVEGIRAFVRPKAWHLKGG